MQLEYNMFNYNEEWNKESLIKRSQNYSISSNYQYCLKYRNKMRILLKLK